MDTLPRFAAVALVARCAELLLPALDTLWRDRPEHVDVLIKCAINGAIDTAKNGSEVDGLITTEEEITRLVGKFELHFHGIPVEMIELPVSVTNLADEQIRTIRDITEVMARSARAAITNDSSGAVSESNDGVSWALSVAESLGDSDLLGRITEAVQSLSRHCTTSGVSDESTVWWTGSEWLSNN